MYRHAADSGQSLFRDRVDLITFRDHPLTPSQEIMIYGEIAFR